MISFSIDESSYQYTISENILWAVFCHHSFTKIYKPKMLIKKSFENYLYEKAAHEMYVKQTPKFISSDAK